MATNITVNDVVNFIWSGSCSSSDRQRIIQALNTQRKVATSQAAAQFVRGDTVEFTAKDGRLIKGNVTKVNRVTVFVTETGGARWRVSPTFLRKAQ